MSVPHIFDNRRVPTSAFDIDADKVNQNFASLVDGSALDPASITLSNLDAGVLAAIGGFLQNFLINGSFESFDGTDFQRWVFDDSADPTAVLAQSSTPANVRFGQNSAQIDTGTGAAGDIILKQSLDNFSDLAASMVLPGKRINSPVRKGLEFVIERGSSVAPAGGSIPKFVGSVNAN